MGVASAPSGVLCRRISAGTLGRVSDCSGSWHADFKVPSALVMADAARVRGVPGEQGALLWVLSFVSLRLS